MYSEIRKTKQIMKRLVQGSMPHVETTFLSFVYVFIINFFNQPLRLIVVVGEFDKISRHQTTGMSELQCY